MDPAARSRGLQREYTLGVGERQVKTCGVMQKMSDQLRLPNYCCRRAYSMLKGRYVILLEFSSSADEHHSKGNIRTYRVAIVYSISARRVNPVIITKYQLSPSCVQLKVCAQHVGVPGQSRGFPRPALQGRMDESSDGIME